MIELFSWEVIKYQIKLLIFISVVQNARNMLEQEFKYYLDNQPQLVEKYNGKFLVIKGQEIIGVHETKESAYFKTQEHHELGTFLIQLCSPGDSSYTQTYHSRVFFNGH